jgi:hypothetical protein
VTEQIRDGTLTAEDMALGYKQLQRVEESWRAMKSGLRMRPVFAVRRIAFKRPEDC